MLASICQLILEGMLLTTEQGEYKLSASFLDEQRIAVYMRSLFWNTKQQGVSCIKCECISDSMGIG